MLLKHNDAGEKEVELGATPVCVNAGVPFLAVNCVVLQEATVFVNFSLVFLSFNTFEIAF